MKFCTIIKLKNKISMTGCNCEIIKENTIRESKLSENSTIHCNLYNLF